MTEDSDTDYSDLEEDAETAIKPKKVSSNEKMEPGHHNDILQSRVDSELAAVLSTATTNVVLPGVSVNSQTKGKVTTAANLRGGRHQSSSPTFLPRHRNRQSSGSSSTSYASGSDGREGSYHIGNKVASRRINSSEKLASTIRQMLPRRDSSEGTKSSPLVEDNKDCGATRAQDKNGPVVVRNVVRNGDVRSTCLIPVPNGDTRVCSSKGGTGTSTNSVLNSVGSASNKSEASGTRAERNKGKDAATGKKRTSFEKLVDIIPIERPCGSTSTWKDSISSDYQLSDVADLDNNADVFSPSLDKQSSSVLKSLPNLELSEEGGDGGGAKSSVDGRKVMSTRCVRDDSIITNDEEDDMVDDLRSFKHKVRSRTQTLSGLTGGKRRPEIGRKKLKEYRLEMKRFSSVSAAQTLSSGTEQVAKEDRKILRKELELLSPLLQTKIRNMTMKRIYSEYGGKDMVMKAVCVIEMAYQTYKLRKRFEERLKERRENRTFQRKRAFSLRQPHRRPSIMNKRGRYPRGEKKGEEKDPITKSKEAVERLAKGRLPHAHSGSRLELVEKRRSEGSLGLRGFRVEEEKEGEEEEGEGVGKSGEVEREKPKRKMVSHLCV